MIKSIKILDTLSHYDGILEGLGLYNDEVCYFKITDDHDWDMDHTKPRTFNVYKLVDREKINYLIQSLMFRNIHNRSYSGKYSTDIAREDAADYEKESVPFSLTDLSEEHLIG